MKKFLCTIVLLMVALLPLQTIQASKSHQLTKRFTVDEIGLNISNNSSNSYSIIITGPTNMTVTVAAHSYPSVGPFLPGTYTFTLSGCGSNGLAFQCTTYQSVSNTSCSYSLTNASMTSTSFLWIL